MTNMQQPAAALDFFLMISNVKCSIARYCLTFWKLTSGTSPLSIRSFRPLRRALYAATSVIRSCVAFHVRSFGIPRWSVAISVAPPAFASSTRVAANTSSTPPGAFAIPFTSPNSLLSRQSSSASASRSAAFASARAASAAADPTVPVSPAPGSPLAALDASSSWMSGIASATRRSRLSLSAPGVCISIARGSSTFSARGKRWPTLKPRWPHSSLPESAPNSVSSLRSSTRLCRC